ncbi:glycosyl-transferase for dystroglycan-domain-containing protein [Suillus subaureus]|uniref:Glycosyl-transferase for dystroglycan-domain-containing protein n=1 Tax=Suillus subaureus TaxID=48587 RepID=A0A9P7ECY1_9AGAM|nr:glycosyl-transferase for dystroglycan-domain-containing protein [Suillus subaureus]KAG1817936.1 glycosyl-transferase for dystroglycan-domain-containing protein [Suillus subaureus]
MSDFSRGLKFIRLATSLYVAIAVLYTANHILSPLRTFARSYMASYDTAVIQVYQYAEVTGKTSQEMILWPASSLAEHTTARTPDGIPMSEDLFLSKAFSQSLHPLKVVPYYYRASGTFEQNDITVTTLVTFNRFKVFSELVTHYQGPISATVHVKPSAIHALLDALHDLYASTPTMSTYVDIHLVLTPFDRQLNTWRNAARLFARTEFIMMLDVDFAICTNFRSAIRASLDAKIGRILKEGHAALVVPAFEYIKQQDGLDQKYFPRDKQALLSLVKAKKIDMFHRTWAPGHNSTDYPRFYSAAPGEVYKVTQYHPAYEPYVIFRKEGPPWCDERFVGYGGNKAACLYEMYLSGMSFYVLADHFLVHQSHPYEEEARKLERKSNRKIYQDFKEEVCLRYLKRHYDSGTLNTSHGYNVQEECKKIRGVSKIAALMIEGRF